MPTPMRYAGWLPPIRINGSTGWLAFKTSSVVAITGAITLEDAASTRVRNSLVEAVRSDPSLLFFTAAAASLQCPEPAGPWTLEKFADWWCRHGRSTWRHADWLAAPTDSSAASRLARLIELDDYFCVLPHARWLDEGNLWFAAAGTANPLTAAFEIAWPADARTKNSRGIFADAQLTIDSWIRERDDCEIRREEFSHAVEASKRDLAHTLAYGLSHEINNPLANISTRAQALRTRVPAPLSDSVQRIVDQTTRAHAMIADLMFYANPPAMEEFEFDLWDRIGWVCDSLSETAERLGIEIQLANGAATEAVIVTADAEMIGEAIAALIRNSIEAIGIDGQVRIDVAQDESAVRISVADSGPGISADEVAMATSPYYSGREAGRGLGLGLCRAERIAGLHGGSLHLTPAIAGCVATIVLPT